MPSTGKGGPWLQQRAAGKCRNRALLRGRSSARGLDARRFDSDSSTFSPTTKEPAADRRGDRSVQLSTDWWRDGFGRDDPDDGESCFAVAWVVPLHPVILVSIDATDCGGRHHIVAPNASLGMRRSRHHV